MSRMLYGTVYVRCYGTLVHTSLLLFERPTVFIVYFFLQVIVFMSFKYSVKFELFSDSLVFKNVLMVCMLSIFSCFFKKKFVGLSC